MDAGGDAPAQVAPGGIRAGGGRGCLNGFALAAGAPSRSRVVGAGRLGARRRPRRLADPGRAPAAVTARRRSAGSGAGGQSASGDVDSGALPDRRCAAGRSAPALIAGADRASRPAWDGRGLGLPTVAVITRFARGDGWLLAALVVAGWRGVVRPATLPPCDPATLSPVTHHPSLP